MTVTWKDFPLGIAVVDESKDGSLLIHHVPIRDTKKETRLSGIWKLSDPTTREVNDRISHWIIIGTRDGVERTESVLGHPIETADLAEFVAACEEANEALNDVWQEYQDEEPRKRLNLTPLAARSWPAIGEDGDAARIMKRVGQIPYPPSAPTEMRDILVLANLVKYVADTWYDLETDRISRAYLNRGDIQRRLYPKDWFAKFSPYWPKAS
jgi:hypothetical protein